MKILKKRFAKWGEGIVKLIPTDDEDLWHIYNLIRKGDYITMKSRRKIIDETNVTGLKKVMAKMLTLTLLIVEIDYFAEGDRLAISIKGRNAKQNDYLKIGQYHTFCIELDQQITIYKECWEMFEFNLLKELSNDKFGVEIAAMVMDEGVAHLCYVKPTITLLKQKIEKNVARKSCGEEIYRKSLNKFLAECYAAIKSVDFAMIKCLVLASPGFVNQQLLKYMKLEAEREGGKAILKNLEKCLMIKCSNGYMNSLNQVLSDPTVMSKMENTKAINQSRLLDKFYEVMKKNENRIAYGEKDVTRCIKMQAVDSLLIVDNLFRCKDFKKRRMYSNLVEDVKKLGGIAVIFSGLHPSGEKLKSITGIAAILRYDVEPLEEEEQEEEPVVEEKEQELEDKFNNFDMKKISENQSESESDEDIM